MKGTGEINASIPEVVSTNCDAGCASLPARMTVHAEARIWVKKQSPVTLNASLLSQTLIAR